MKIFTDYGAAGNGTADDTLAMQELINANPSWGVLDGNGKTYRITAPLNIPNQSRFLEIRNLTILADGDIEVFRHAAGATAINYFALTRALILCEAHTTFERRAIDFSVMSFSKFVDVWVNGTPAKTICFFGAGGTGSSPYYNSFDHCYMGNLAAGIVFNDSLTAAGGCNSNTVTDCRIQPGSGNTGVYIGDNCQNIRIENVTFESSGGTGIYNSGHATFISGCRFEAMTTGITYTCGAFACTESGNYFDPPSGNHRTFFGSSATRNIVLNENSLASGQATRFYGEFSVNGTYHVGTEQVLEARRTGWTPPTGASSRASFDPGTVTLPELAQRLKALIDDLHSDTGHGLIGH